MPPADKPCKPLSTLGLIALSVLVGVIASLGAVLFRALIALFHNLLFLGSFSFSYDANIHTPASPWGPLVILVPVIGAACVAFLVSRFAPETRGHGVPEVMDAIYYNKGFIRPVVAVIKSLASALSIGSGGSVGREGPIIQIGSAFGSTIAQLLELPVWQRITMIAAGAGGGIAATFNTPLGGVLFAMEILLHEVSVKTLVPVAIATATATYVGRLFFGVHPSFVIPAFEVPYFHLTNPLVLLTYLGLGLLAGAMSAVYIRSIYDCEDLFARLVPNNYYLRHMLGMLPVGILLYLLLLTTGHYYVEGVGYSTVQSILIGDLNRPGLLVILFVLKLLATALALGSGASGGIFSPALFLGATMGGAYGVILHYFLPGLEISPPAFAVAGMAGMVGGSTGAAIAAIVMVLEMTLDYSVAIPITLTVAISYAVRTILCRESIYTLKLARRGHFMPEAFHTNVHRLQRAREVMERRLLPVAAAANLVQFARLTAEHPAVDWYLVTDGETVTGIVAKESALEVLCRAGLRTTMADLVQQDYIVIGGQATLFDVMARMRAAGASVALVTDPGTPLTVDRVRGIIGKQRIADVVAGTFEFFSEEESDECRIELPGRPPR